MSLKIFNSSLITPMSYIAIVADISEIFWGVFDSGVCWGFIKVENHCIKWIKCWDNWIEL